MSYSVPVTASPDHEMVTARIRSFPRTHVYAAWTRAPEVGPEFDNEGGFRQVVENELIVFTDAYTAGWKPTAKPFFTGHLSFEDAGGRARYTARGRHGKAARGHGSPVGRGHGRGPAFAVRHRGEPGVIEN